MEIKRLDRNNISDFRALIDIFKDVFENNAEIPGDEYLCTLLARQDFMVFVVKLNDKVVGGLTIYILHQYYSVNPLAYIYDVGISTGFQGRGLGKALIAEACSYCKANGFEEAYVEAENDDMDAIDFYRKTKFHSEIVARHFTYSFKDERNNNNNGC